MPLGNRFVFATITLLESRYPAQPSSKFTYWYPAASIPLVAIWSAMFSMRLSLMVTLYEYHELKPIGGSSATPLLSARAGATHNSTAANQVSIVNAENAGVRRAGNCTAGCDRRRAGRCCVSMVPLIRPQTDAASEHSCRRRIDLLKGFLSETSWKFNPNPIPSVVFPCR